MLATVDRGGEMSTRRTRGDGGLYQRADGMWVGVVDSGIDEHGRRKRATVSSKSQAEALRKLRALRQALAAGLPAPSQAASVGGWLERWVENVVDVRPTTRATYRRTIDNYLIPKLGRIRLVKLAPSDVRELERWMTEDRGLSQDTAHGAYRVLRAALSDAVREGLIASNVCRDRAKAPRLPRAEPTILTAEQARRVIVETLGTWWGPRWAVGLLTGARQGEVLGLEWSRVDFTGGTIDLSWQLQRIAWRHGCDETCGLSAVRCPIRELDLRRGDKVRQLDGGLCLTVPKTATGTRLIPMPKHLSAVLGRQADQVRGVDRGHDLVFVEQEGARARAGRPVDFSRDNARWHEMLAELELPDVKLHAARHTTASLLLALGVDIRVVQQIMGHSSAAISRHYQHVDMTLARLAMDGIGELFGELPALSPA